MQGSMATTTPLVKSIFDSMFKEQIDEGEGKDGGGRRRRCGTCEVNFAKPDLLPVEREWRAGKQPTRNFLKWRMTLFLSCILVLQGTRLWEVQELSEHGQIWREWQIKTSVCFEEVSEHEYQRC